MPNPSKAPQRTAYRQQNFESTPSRYTGYLQLKYNTFELSRQERCSLELTLQLFESDFVQRIRKGFCPLKWRYELHGQKQIGSYVAGCRRESFSSLGGCKIKQV